MSHEVLWGCGRESISDRGNSKSKVYSERLLNYMTCPKLNS